MLSPIHKSYKTRGSHKVLTCFAWRVICFGLMFGVAASWALFKVFVVDGY
ncbi:hypothetical protein [Pseudobacteriovorax antillogorgiicola]|uniref:Uncharacterized protein n=1 Tax=Pseudobacteriovorax antillogorgiicola TaxID=1513793 RepID=A0A1Y6CM60_9BACT|nr:hypothetical protein [Pseudobacteriovorax antillogorgiicola]TCS46907.1 hypothetical protein EDD56_1222 [Pseudobacteriovorax antillogorgiicola]SMF64059.1 hypothetical protein SAMN06296036_1222 [Pseudobacteriovorax antillogorgiicola]